MRRCAARRGSPRSVFYGGTLFFIAISVILSYKNVGYIVKKSTANAELTETVVRGKRVWEANACAICHTILGEGAYFAPELANVMRRRGVEDDPEGAFDALQGWVQAQPGGIEGRRQMPKFNLTDDQIRDLANFFIWVGKIASQSWPPTDAG